MAGDRDTLDRQLSDQAASRIAAQEAQAGRVKGDVQLSMLPGSAQIVDLASQTEGAVFAGAAEPATVGKISPEPVEIKQFTSTSGRWGRPE